MKKKLFSFLLSLAMVMAMIPAMASVSFASEENTTATSEQVEMQVSDSKETTNEIEGQESADNQTGDIIPVSEIIPPNFPTDAENGWKNENGCTCYLKDGCLIMSAPKGPEMGLDVNINNVTVYEGYYQCWYFKFNCPNGEVTSITFDGGVAGLEGTYVPQNESSINKAPVESVKATTQDSEKDDSTDDINTGDTGNLLFYGFTTLLALLGAGYVYRLRRKEDR